MMNHKFENPQATKQEKGMSRRDFLKLTGLAVGVIITSKISLPDKTQGYYSLGRDEQIGSSEETDKMLSEIVAFRKSLGLKRLPAEVIPGLVKKERWLGNPDNYVDALPEKNRSYSMRTFEVIQKIFGDNATRIIKGSKSDPYHPYGMSFDGPSRFCNISDSVHSIPLEDQFTNYVLHEACGHGSDPALGASYPPEILVRVEHGKWRALSQALSIPGQFLSHPEDQMFPLVKKSVGEIVGRFMVGEHSIPIVDVQSYSTVRNVVARIASEKGKNIDAIKFNKAACRKIGEELIDLLRKGRIKFVGDLKDSYQSSMEDACIEIYAEMIKYALLYPDKIQYNSDVIGGITEVISAIGGKSNIVELRESINKPSEEILRRNEAEKAIFSQVPATQPFTTLTPEEQERLRIQQSEFEKNKKAFQHFSENSDVQTLTISDGQRDDVARFTTLYGEVIQKYPMLIDTFNQKNDESFDPEMHIWEIREIERAVDSGFVRSILSSSIISNEMINDMKSRTEVLENFVGSPAF